MAGQHLEGLQGHRDSILKGRFAHQGRLVQTRHRFDVFPRITGQLAQFLGPFVLNRY